MSADPGLARHRQGPRGPRRDRAAYPRAGRSARQALGAGKAARLPELVHPLLEAVLPTGLFPPNTTLGIGKVPQFLGNDRSV